MKNGNRTAINLACSFLVLGTSICINLFMSPYIVSKIGVEANGFITLANNFTTYLNLFILALNSMAARFISIEYNKQNYQKANLYYNSVFWGNLVLVLIFAPIMFWGIFNLQKWIDIPPELVSDVKGLFALVLLNFFLATAAPNWECGVFTTNRLDRQYIPNVITSLLKCALLYISLTLIVPKVWYVGLVTFIVGTINLCVNGYNTHALTPRLKIGFRKGKRTWSIDAIKQLLSAGIWNSITSAGWMLLNGLDLLIANLFINSTAMGLISLSKILYTLMTEFSNSINRVFVPSMVIDYATGDSKNLVANVKKWVKISSVLMVTPLAGIMVLSDDFFRLWVPRQDYMLLSRLSMLACAGSIFLCGSQVLFQLFTVTNRLKAYSVSVLASGVISSLVVFGILRINSDETFGMYVIVGTSTVVAVIRNLLFLIPLAARSLDQKATVFYPVNLMCITNAVVCIAVSSFVRSFFTINNWIEFIFIACLIAITNFVLSSIILLNKNEKRELLEKITGKLIKR